ncbi:MAG: hypothetical protein ACFFDI_09435 [Promethearchaeota archaeon]
MNLENDIYEHLNNDQRPKIHVSEIKKCITTSEEQIKDILLKITSEDPILGKFDYSTGWLERELSVESPESLNIRKFLL